MNKRFFVAMAIVLVSVVSALAFTSSIGSGKISESSVVVNKPCYLFSVSIRDDGTNALTVTVYDSAEATTDVTKLIREQKIEAGGDRSSTMTWIYPRKCDRGIYVVISGGTGYAVVEYNFN